MADDRTSVQRSETMRRVKSRDTSPELALRSAVHSRGLRYSLRGGLPGRPDLIFRSARVAVFVDGCFWHGCPEHCRRPSSNREYWRAKIERNMERDRRIRKELEDRGWRVIRMWEHEVKQSAARCASRIERVVRGRRRRLMAGPEAESGSGATTSPGRPPRRKAARG